MNSIIKASISNLYAALLCIFLMPKRATHYLVATPLQIILLIFIELALNFGFDLYRVGLDGKFNLWAPQAWLASISLALFAAWLCSVFFRRKELLLQLATLSVAISIILFLCADLLQQLLALFLDLTKQNTTGLWVLQWGVWWFPTVWYAICLATSAIVWSNKTWHGWVLAALPWGMTLFSMFWLGMVGQRLWIEDYSLREGQEYVPRQLTQEQAEKLIYTQPLILQNATESIAQGVAGQPELFFLAIAGYGEQDVFMKEVLAVNRFVQQKFTSEKRSLLLVNNAKTIDQYPMATVTSIRQGLSVLAKKMNLEEDVLLIFMTSHGSKGENKKPHEFSMSLEPLVLQQLTPSMLKAALDEADIKHRVIVVSACYSGGFLPELQTSDSLLISASHAERNSFGCADENEWTDFGRAYFFEAFNQESSFIRAFERAKEVIAQREKKKICFILNHKYMSDKILKIP